MRDNHEGYTEIVGAYKRDGNFFRVDRSALIHRNHRSVRDPAANRDDQLMVARGKSLGYLDIGLGQTDKTGRQHQRKDLRFNAADRCLDVQGGEAQRVGGCGGSGSNGGLHLSGAGKKSQDDAASIRGRGRHVHGPILVDHRRAVALKQKQPRTRGRDQRLGRSLINSPDITTTSTEGLPATAKGIWKFTCFGPT